MRRFVRKDASSEPRDLQGGAGAGDLWEEIVAAECGVGAVVRSRELLDGKRCQYLYFCTSKAIGSVHAAGCFDLDRPVNAPGNETARIIERGGHTPRRCQYLYFCASNASKLSTCQRARG